METTGRRKVKELDVMVADVVRETPDTTTLVLFTGNDKLDYEPGHFLMIDPHQFNALDRFTRYLEDQKGRREPARAYSLASAPHERFLSITVKEEQYVSGQTPYPPLLSPLLVNRVGVGTQRRLLRGCDAGGIAEHKGNQDGDVAADRETHGLDCTGRQPRLGVARRGHV